jgi:geranylgeranyl pyrophosphate synthase
MKVDCKTLTEVIEKCFDYAGTDQFSQEERTSFLAEGKRLRGLLLTLLTAKFDENTKPVATANTQMKVVNQAIASRKKVLDDVAGAIQALADLVGILDELVELAAKFL